MSHLSEQEHQHAEAAEGRRREVEWLYEFSQQLLLQEDLRSVARTNAVGRGSGIWIWGRSALSA